MAARYEYRIVKFPSSAGMATTMNVYLDEVGREGWELVSTETLIAPSFWRQVTSTQYVLAFFKRPLG